MTPPSHPSPPSLEVARERTIQALCSHFAYDRLTTEEVDERLERAQRARTVGELEQLLADLPATEVPPPDETRPGALTTGYDARETGRVLALLGEVKRTGVWTPPRELRVAAVLGSVTVDLRDARLSPGVTEIRVAAVMGEVKVIVPPGVRVESNATAFLGAVTDDVYEPVSPDGGTPVVRISGFAFLAEVKTRLRAPKRRPHD